METYFGVWTPSSGVLPTVTDLDFAAYYITESGTLNGVTYTKDKWLVYICEARGTLSERSYWRVTDGIVTFNPDTHTNVPDAGYYTKVRLDNAGNIIAGSDIEMDDLPAEVAEKFEAITDDNLNKLIAAQLGGIFVNNTLNPIQFSYDSKTGKISATLKLDEETIGINDFGQLEAIGTTSESASSSSVTVDLTAYTEELEEIKEHLTAAEEKIVKITPIAGGGITLSAQTGGTVISVDIDENSLSYDSNGRLCVNPDILTDYINDESGNCANHTHSASQITDLEDFVKDIINNVSIYNTLVQNLSNLVDESTIIINSNGQLQAVAASTQKHTHTMGDITDLNQDIANVWATNQRLHASNDNQDFDSGAVTMSTLTIGEVLIAFNELLKEYKTALDAVDSKVGTVEPAEPNYINYVAIENYADAATVLDVTTFKEVEAYPKIKVGTSDVINYHGGYLYCYIDDVKVGTLKVFDDSTTTFSVGQRGKFYVTYFGEAYPKMKTFQGYYKGFSFYYEDTVAEGTHTVYFVQEDINTGAVWKSEEISVNVYAAPSTCEVNIDITSQPSTNAYVSGIKATTDEPIVSYNVNVKNFGVKYAPIGTITSKVEGYGEYELSPYEVSGNYLVYGPQTVELGDFYGEATISATASTIAGTEGSATKNTSFINYDDTTEEAYRVISSGEMTPQEGSIVTVQGYDTAQSLTGDLEDEAQVKDHIAVIGKVNYSEVNLGDDYSVKPPTQQIMLRFECPNKINNFYFDLVDDEDAAYTVNKNGTLDAIDIYASIAPSTAISRWVNCNVPYAGYGHWESTSIFNGLDLFRSSDKRRYVTFGKDPTVETGYLYIKLIITKPINLKTLVESIEESLNERG